MGKFKFSYRDGWYWDNEDPVYFTAPGQQFIDGNTGEIINPLKVRPVSKKWFSKEEEKIIEDYMELARLNPENKTYCDRAIYVFVKIMFGHPLKDGNKRLACKWLLFNCGVHESTIEAVCESLAKEVF